MAVDLSGENRPLDQLMALNSVSTGRIVTEQNRHDFGVQWTTEIDQSYQCKKGERSC